MAASTRNTDKWTTSLQTHRVKEDATAITKARAAATEVVQLAIQQLNQSMAQPGGPPFDFGGTLIEAVAFKIFEARNEGWAAARDELHRHLTPMTGTMKATRDPIPASLEAPKKF